MGAFYCPDHKFYFPISACPVKGCTAHPYWTPNAQPSTGWASYAEKETERLREEAAQEKMKPAVKPGQPIPSADVEIHHYADHDWVSHQDLICAGYRCLEDFSVVKIRDKFYELQACVCRRLITGVPDGAWWVEEVDVDGEVEHMLGALAA